MHFFEWARVKKGWSPGTPLIVRNKTSLQTFRKVSPEIGNNGAKRGFVISRFLLFSFSRDRNKLRPIRRKYCISVSLVSCAQQKVAETLPHGTSRIFIERNYLLVNRLRFSDNKHVKWKYLPFSQLRVKSEIRGKSCKQWAKINTFEILYFFTLYFAVYYKVKQINKRCSLCSQAISTFDGELLSISIKAGLAGK
jgi:hypothetical protein